MSAALEQEVRRVLGEVDDPCSLANRTPVSIVDMGMVESVRVDALGNVEVVLCLTSLSCTMFPHFTGAARRKIAALPGVRSVSVEIDYEVLWTEDRLTPAGQEAIGQRRHLQRLAATRQAWRKSPNPPLSRRRSRL